MEVTRAKAKAEAYAAKAAAAQTKAAAEAARASTAELKAQESSQMYDQEKENSNQARSELLEAEATFQDLIGQLKTHVQVDFLVKQCILSLFCLKLPS